MRIIHFSDLHAGHWPRQPGAYFTKRFLGALNFTLRRRTKCDWSLVQAAVKRIPDLEPDLVICTGDLTSISDPAEFADACQALCGLSENKRFDFLYVPGNHDRYVDTVECIRELERAFQMLNKKRWLLRDLPVTHRVEAVDCILLDECIPNPFFSSGGTIPPATLADLHTLIDQDPDRIKILVHHFPVLDAQGRKLSWRRRCAGNQELAQALQQGRILLSLCGHIHTQYIRTETSGSAEVCAGSLTHNGLLNCLDISPADNTFTQQWISVKP